MADASITLPWAVWAAIGTAGVSAVVWLARIVVSMQGQMVALVREVVAAVASNTATLQEVLETVKELRRNG